MASNPKDVANEDRRLIYTTVAQGANDLYRTMITVASSFLGGSLLFLEKFAPSPPRWSMWLLALGWGALVLSVMCTARVLRLNNISGRHALENKWEESGKVWKNADRYTDWAGYSLCVGIAMIMLFGFINVML